MAETVDELLVKLGLETDAKSFQDANNMFSNLRTTALATGTAVAAGFAGAAAAAVNFAKAKAEMGDFAKDAGVAVGYIDQLSLAMENAGGSAQDAMALISNVNDLREQANWGELPERAFTEAGFNPDQMRTMSTPEAIDWLAQAAGSMDAETRRRILGELGIGQHGRNMLSDPAQMREDFADAERYGITTQEMVDESREMLEAITEMKAAFGGITDEITLNLLPAMTRWTTKVTDWLGENNDGITKLADYAFNTSPETVVEDTRRIAQDEDVQSLIKDSWDSYVEWNTPLRLIRDAWFSDEDNEGQSVDPTGAVYLQSILRDNERRAQELNLPSNGSLRPDEMNYEPSSSEFIPSSRPTGDIRGRVERGEHTPGDYEYLRQQMRQFYPEQYGLNVGPPSGSSMGAPATASNTNYYSIDARGATDPGATEATIRRVFHSELRNVSEMSQDDFPDNVA